MTDEELERITNEMHERAKALLAHRPKRFDLTMRKLVAESERLGLYDLPPPPYQKENET